MIVKQSQPIGNFFSEATKVNPQSSLFNDISSPTNKSPTNRSPTNKDADTDDEDDLIIGDEGEKVVSKKLNMTNPNSLIKY